MWWNECTNFQQKKRRLIAVYLIHTAIMRILPYDIKEFESLAFCLHHVFKGRSGKKKWDRFLWAFQPIKFFFLQLADLYDAYGTMGNARTRKGQLLSWNEGSDWLRNMNMNMGNNFKKMEQEKLEEKGKLGKKRKVNRHKKCIYCEKPRERTKRRKPTCSASSEQLFSLFDVVVVVICWFFFHWFFMEFYSGKLIKNLLVFNVK